MLPQRWVTSTSLCMVGEHMAIESVTCLAFITAIRTVVAGKCYPRSASILLSLLLQYAYSLVDTRNDCGGRGGRLASRAPKTPERIDRRRNPCQRAVAR